MFELAIGLGVFFSLLFSEILGVTAGGIVVPGYIALHMHDPIRVVATFIVSIIVFLILRGLCKVMFVYGKRRLVLALLLGFVFGYLSRQYYLYDIFGASVKLQAVGFIIPGLIANWMERQGVVRTVSLLLITAVLVQLLLMVITGGQIGIEV